MKGLMIKDLRLLFNQKKTWIMYVLLCVMMGFSMQGAFMVGYTVMLCGALGISTISYDQAENGMPFLFTLPIDRQGYVREKYLLCLMMEAAGAMFGLTVCEIVSLIKTGIPGAVHRQLLAQDLPVGIPGQQIIAVGVAHRDDRSARPGRNKP